MGRINVKTADIRKIRRKMEKVLDPKRFEHTLGVAYTASALAMCYDVDINNYKIGKISLLGEKMAITFSPEKIYEKIIYFVLNKGKEVK